MRATSAHSSLVVPVLADKSLRTSPSPRPPIVVRGAEATLCREEVNSRERTTRVGKIGNVAGLAGRKRDRRCGLRRRCGERWCV